MKRAKEYDESVRQDAIRLVVEKGEKVKDTATNLGIGLSTLSRWVSNHRLGRRANPLDKSPLNPEEIELRSALRKLKIVEEERDILKKALGIFSQLNK